jgi:hypothetical protein
MRMMRMHYPLPQWLAKLMDYIHTWLNKWRMQGNLPKSKVMVFPLEENPSGVQDRLNTWTRRHRH